jgi:hypothetical protein
VGTGSRRTSEVTEYAELVERSGSFEFPLLDPQADSELRLVVPHLLDEPTRVLAPDEHVDRFAEDVGRRERVNPPPSSSAK